MRCRTRERRAGGRKRHAACGSSGEPATHSGRRTRSHRCGISGPDRTPIRPEWWVPARRRERSPWPASHRPMSMSPNSTILSRSKSSDSWRHLASARPVKADPSSQTETSGRAPYSPSPPTEGRCHSVIPESTRSNCNGSSGQPCSCGATCATNQVVGAEVALCSNGGAGALFCDVLLLGRERP